MKIEDMEHTLAVRDLGEKVLGLLSDNEGNILVTVGLDVLAACAASIVGGLPKEHRKPVMMEYFSRVGLYTSEMSNDA